MPSILAVAGSIRAGATSRKALDIAVEGATSAGATVVVADLGNPLLPILDSDGTAEHPAAAQFRAQVRAADALLIATPVYHDSFSGVLKNALDHLYDELREKIVAVIAVGGGRSGQGQALEHLRAVLRETSSWVIPRQVIVSQSESAFHGDTHRPIDPEIELRLQQLGKELVLRTRAMRSPRRAPPR